MWNTFPSSYVSCLFNSIITVLYSIFKILIIFILIIFILILILMITISFLVDRKAINLTSTLPPMPAFPPFPTRNGDVVTMPTPS